jgi:hypothetical protein
LEKKYNFCSTKVYTNCKKDENGNFIEQNNYVLLSYNYSDYIRSRNVVIKLDDNTEYTVYQSLGGRDSWTFEYIPKNIKSIGVFENEKLIFTEEITKPKSIIYFN